MKKAVIRNPKNLHLSVKEKLILQKKVEEIKKRRKVLWQFNDEAIGDIKNILYEEIEDPKIVDQFFMLLALECALVPLDEVFQAGKDSYKQNKTARQGFNDYMLRVNSEPATVKFVKDFNDTYSLLRKEISDKRTLLCIDYLLSLYRNAYSLNSELDEIFMLGYRRSKRRRSVRTESTIPCIVKG